MVAGSRLVPMQTPAMISANTMATMEMIRSFWFFMTV